MGPTAFGPQGPNYATTRPGFAADVSQGLDTWARDCSQPGAKDGTYFNAEFFNIIIANLREAVRSSGIALDKTDDHMLSKAILATARSAWTWTTITGGVNALIATPDIALTELKPGQKIYGAVSGPNTGAVTTNIPGIGTFNVVRNADGSALKGGELTGVITLLFDGTQLRLMGVVPIDILTIIQSVTRINLTINLVLNVRPDGSDTNDGSADSADKAFKTPQGAYNAATKKYNLAGFSVTLQLSKTYGAQVNGGAPVTYPGIIAANVGVTGNISLQGDNAALANHILSPVPLGNGSSFCVANSVSTFGVSGVTLDASAVTTGGCIAALSGQTNYGNVALKFGGNSPSINLVSISQGATISRNGPVSVLGNGSLNAVIFNNGGFDQGCTLTNPQNFAINGMTFGAFIQTVQGYVSLAQTTFSGGGNTGLQWRNVDGLIDLASIPVANVPGSLAGVNSYGGKVIGAPLSSYAPVLSGSGAAFNVVSALYEQDGKRLYLHVVFQTTYTGSPPPNIAVPLPGAVLPNGAQSLGGANVSGVFSVVATASSAQAFLSITKSDGSSPLTTSGQYISVQGTIDLQ